ncbi:hypothetical protein IID20_01390 [Patescibacteria group bacterium]|nr:hypothetical protein [Patescibacteria group bacterium]
MKKLFFLLMIISLALGLYPSIGLAQTSVTETKHFVMTVKWGNVRGEVSDKAKAIFDGSVSSDDSSVRISLIRELLFENHDSLVSKKNPVSWTSLIYNHWDGVRVLVSAPTTATITVDVGQGTVSKTVQELFDSKEAVVMDVGNGKEIIIKVHPYKNSQAFMTVFWGDGPKGQKADFTGSMVLVGGSKLKFKKALRFEKDDMIVSDSETEISWNSIIVGGKDGVLFMIKFDKNVDNDDTLSFNFTSLGWSKTYRLIDLYHNRITRDIISNATVLTCLNSSADENNVLTVCTTNGQTAQASTRPYHLVIALKQDQHTNKRLIKHKNSSTVYMIEDGIKKPIISAEVFEDNKLDWSKVETVEQEEVESYAEGEVLNYPDGVLVKGSGPAVYIISGGRKRPVKSAAAFLRLGYKWEHIRTIRDAEVNAYPTDSYVTETSDHPEGALIREKGKSGVYVIKGGKKRPIRSADIFNTRGYKWDRVLEVEKSALDKFQDGETETYPDGTLVQGEGQGGVYIIDKGKKRAFKSAKDFLSMRKEWTDIKNIKVSEINALLTGEDMIGQ